MELDPASKEVETICLLTDLPEELLHDIDAAERRSGDREGGWIAA